MNKKQIKAELRRSALEDEYPYWDTDLEAWFYANAMCKESIFDLSKNDSRTFFLIVAEAL